MGGAGGGAKRTEDDQRDTDDGWYLSAWAGAYRVGRRRLPLYLPQTWPMSSADGSGSNRSVCKGNGGTWENRTRRRGWGRKESGPDNACRIVFVGWGGVRTEMKAEQAPRVEKGEGGTSHTQDGGKQANKRKDERQALILVVTTAGQLAAGQLYSYSYKYK